MKNATKMLTFLRFIYEIFYTTFYFYRGCFSIYFVISDSGAAQVKFSVFYFCLYSC